MDDVTEAPSALDVEEVHAPPESVEPVVFGDESEVEAPKERTQNSVPVEVLQKERHKRQQLQQRIESLEADLASKRERVKEETAKVDTKADKTEAVKQWQSALEIDKAQSKIADLEAKIEEMSENIGYSERQAQFAEQQYYDSVGGFVLDKFYKANNYPITDNQYAQLFAAEMSPEEHEAVRDHDLSALEDIARRVHRGFKQQPTALKEAKDYRKIQELPTMPGRGGGPAPEPEEAPVTGKELHRKAAAHFEAIKNRR